VVRGCPFFWFSTHGSDFSEYVFTLSVISLIGVRKAAEVTFTVTLRQNGQNAMTKHQLTLARYYLMVDRLGGGGHGREQGRSDDAEQ